MLIFMSMVVLVYGAMHLYAFSKVWMAFPHTYALALALLLWGVGMVFSPFMIWYLERQHWHNATVVLSWIVYLWMGLLLLFCLVSLAFDLAHLLAALSGFKWPDASLTLRVTGLLAVVLTGYGFVEARQIRVEHVTVRTPKLSPDVGRLTIAQLSDMHLGIMLGDKFLRRVMTRLCELKPDIVVATGDIVDGQGDDFNRMAAGFHACTVPKGEFAITGNHEFYVGLDNSLRFLHDAGFTVLRGEPAAAGGVVFVGVDDPAGLATGQEAKPDTRAISEIPKQDFVILLKHQPRVDSTIPFDLQLSGHIHGGQIFPINWITHLVYGVDAGLTKLSGGRWLYVSRGTGSWGPPIRLLAPPEITLITIESAKEQSIAVK